MMIEPAPKVEAATASAARPRAAPDAGPAVASACVAVDAAPAVGPAHAQPPAESSLSAENASAGPPGPVRPMGVEGVRATRMVGFEAPAAVVVGPVEKNSCERILPWCFSERSFVAYGEVKRYIMVADGAIFVYIDITDPSPLYTIQLSDLDPMREDPSHPDFYSHTISPEANTGLPFDNRSKQSLELVLLRDAGGKIAFQIAFDKNEAGPDASNRFMASVEVSKGCAKTIGEV